MFEVPLPIPRRASFWRVLRGGVLPSQIRIQLRGNGGAAAGVGRADEMSARHDGRRLPQGAEVVQRVCGERNQVGCLAGRDCPGDRADSGKLRAAGGRRPERKPVVDSDITVEINQLAPEIVLRNPGAADIVPEHDRNAVGNGCFGAVNDALKHHIPVVLLHLAGM